jgi:hypothetical protein
MTSDRRKGKQPNRDDVKKILNPKQLTALAECRYFGWKLKFVRRPLFLDPVPVLYNARIGHIGAMDPDGQIIIDGKLEVRASQSEPDHIQQPLQVPKLPEAASRGERRKHKIPGSDNLDELLNQHQMRALRHINTFGWKLHFVRRSLFQDPVAVIISPEGDRFATLEHDGRIDMTPDADLRKEAPVEKTASAPSVTVSEVKRA